MRPWHRPGASRSVTVQAPGTDGSSGSCRPGAGSSERLRFSRREAGPPFGFDGGQGGSLKGLPRGAGCAPDRPGGGHVVAAARTARWPVPIRVRGAPLVRRQLRDVGGSLRVARPSFPFRRRISRAKCGTKRSDQRGLDDPGRQPPRCSGRQDVRAGGRSARFLLLEDVGRAISRS